MSCLRINKKLSRLATTFALLLTLLGATVSIAQPLTGVAKEKFLPNSIIQGYETAAIPGLNQDLQLLHKALAFGDSIAVNDSIEKLKAWKNQIGSKNLFFVSRQLVAKAAQFAENGELKQAVQTAKSATKLSPDDYKAKIALARHSFALNKADAGSYLNPLMGATLNYTNDPVSRQILISHILIIIVPALFLAFCLFILSIFSKYRSPLVNDLDRAIPFMMKGGTAWLALILMSVTILLFGGLFWLIIVLPLFLRVYMRTGAVIATFIFLAFLATLPFAVTTIARGTVIKHSAYNSLVNDYLNGNWEPNMIREFSKVSASEPENSELLFTLATLYRKIGKLDRAEKFLSKMQGSGAERVKAIVELGNIHLGRKEYREAEIMYNKALELSPSLVEAYYNLSVTYTGQFRTDDAATAFNTAMSIDKKQTERFVRQGGDIKSANVISLPSNLQRLPLFGGSPNAESVEMANTIWKAILGNVTMKQYIKGSVGYLLLLLLTVYIWSRYDTSTLCSSCGTTFIPALRSANPEKIKCNQCLIVASSKKDVMRSKRDRKTMQIREYQYDSRATANRLNILLPGLGSVFAESYISGAITLCIASVFILKALFLITALVFGYSGILSTSLVVYAAWGAAALVFYLFSQVALRMEL